jgi:YidC/Oxa1 family membrane protein insertase
MNNQKSPFGDNRGLTAIVIIGVFFVFWQWFMSQKYPQKAKAPVSQAISQEQNTTSGQPTSAPGNESTSANSGGNSQEMKSSTMAVPSKILHYDGQKVSFSISSVGMGLKDVTLKTFTDREKKPVRLGLSDEHGLFELRLNKNRQPVNFDLSEKDPGHYVGTAEADGMTIVREITFNEGKQSFESTVELKNAKEEPVEILIPEKISASKGKSFLVPSYDHQDFFVNHEGKNDSVNFSSAKEDINTDYKSVHVAAVSSQYFASAILDQSDITPDLNVHADLSRKEALAEMIYRPAAPGGVVKLAQTFFVGPKSIDILEGINPDLTHIINLGSLSVIARPMLLVMKTFYSWVSNWGLAIIMLTLLVRLAVFPLYMMSTRSMKAMQKVQPMIKDLREKHKDDAMTLNKEMMALMKANKANPLGGCLPMILQIPIFFALYRVIGSSVELYQAPFMLWIQDLSLHDKFFVLPVLMGVTMFIQQKLTPTAMDPAQAKILAFMPIIFSGFMLYLPSGLTLYMLVSAVFGISQQYLMVRDRKGAVATTPALDKRK